jgi:hypothetical protein
MVAFQGHVTVSVLYDYGQQSNLQCFVGDDHDQAVSLQDFGIHIGAVPCSKAPGTYHIQVIAKTNGNTDDTQEVIKVVGAIPELEVQPISSLQAGQPKQCLIRGKMKQGSAYVVCSVYELTLDFRKPPKVVDGVFAYRNVDGTWGVTVRVPNCQKCGYYARIIEFDAYDNIVSKQTVVLN